MGCVGYAVKKLTAVQLAPLCSSASICISSITATSYSFVVLAISIVQDTWLAKGTSRRSCPVIKLQYTPWLLSWGRRGEVRGGGVERRQPQAPYDKGGKSQSMN